LDDRQSQSNYNYLLPVDLLSAALANILPPLSLHSFAVVDTQPIPLHGFFPAQELAAPWQEPLPLHELMPEQFTLASSGQTGICWEFAAALFNFTLALSGRTGICGLLAAALLAKHTVPRATASRTLRFLMVNLQISVVGLQNTTKHKNHNRYDENSRWN